MFVKQRTKLFLKRGSTMMLLLISDIDSHLFKLR